MSFLENLNWRYAAKCFSGGMVSEENLQKILYAIRMSPSSFGPQPYHITVVTNKVVLENLKKYAKNNERKFETCSHMLVFSSRTDIAVRFKTLQEMQKRKDNSLWNIGRGIQFLMPILSWVKMGRLLTKNDWASSQTYIALGFALASCAELKVDSCPMEGFNARKFRKILNLGNNLRPVALLALGTREESDPGLKYPKVRFSEDDLFSKI
jgi:nitroreductase